MNPILLVIIMIGGILILAYQITKNRLLNSLNRALTANDKEAINRITDKSLYVIYICCVFFSKPGRLKN